MSIAPIVGGERAGRVLHDAVVAAGGELVSWSPRQVHHQPDRTTHVRYRVESRSPAGRCTVDTLVVAWSADGRVDVWRWRDDPHLPGLARALDPERVAALVRDVGLPATAPRAVKLRARSYRPGRRAVVEVDAAPLRLFLKVVPPARASALDGLHRRLAGHVPAPETLGCTPDGIVVLRARRGEPLRDLLRAGVASALPGPEALASLLDGLPADLVDATTRPRDVLGRAVHYASVIGSVLPDARPRLDGLLGALDADRPDHAVVPVHGDFYDAQVLVRDGTVAGLVDIDTAGAGHRADDVATLLAHLAVLRLHVARPTLLDRYAAEVLAFAAARTDADDLARRVAAVVLALATGPFRVLDPDWRAATHRLLDLAAVWAAPDRGAIR